LIILLQFSIKMYHIFVHSFINFILLNSVQFQIPVSNAGGVDQPLGSPAGQGCDVSSPAGQGCDMMPQYPFISASSVIRHVSPAGQGCDVSSPAGQDCDVMPQLPFISASSVIRHVSPAGQGCDVSSPAGQDCDVMPQLPFISASSVIRRVSPAGQGCGDRSVFRVNLTKHCCNCRATVIRQNLKIRSLQRQVTYTVCCNNVIS
jgi:hypothetical protein